MLRRIAMRAAVICCAGSFSMAIALSQAPAAISSQPAGSISGIVRDPTGNPLSAIWVTAVRSGLPPASATVASNASGAFSLPNLPAGTYKICAQSPSGAYLDPCWLWCAKIRSERPKEHTSSCRIRSC
jgi:carboxypeptidase family protein